MASEMVVWASHHSTISAACPATACPGPPAAQLFATVPPEEVAALPCHFEELTALLESLGNPLRRMATQARENAEVPPRLTSAPFFWR